MTDDISPAMRVCGKWRDPSRSFLQGATIHIWDEGWAVLDSLGAGKALSPVRSVAASEAAGWELLELGADGTERRLSARHQDGDRLAVRCEANGMEWVLERASAGGQLTSHGSFLRSVPELWPEWQGSAAEIVLSPDSSDYVGHCDTDQKVNDMLMLLNSRRFIVQRDRGTGLAMMLSPEAWQEIFIMKPQSMRRIAWDFLSCFLICFDAFTVPLIVFETELFDDSVLRQSEEKDKEFDFLHTMSWLTVIFWSLDVPMSLLTGFHCNGVIVLQPSKIARHYLRTWAAFDFAILLPDWFFLLFPTASVVGVLRITKGVRFMRIFRAIRLLRFVRLHRMVTDLVDMVNSESLRAFFNIMLALGFIITLNHYVACGWYLLGRIGISNSRPNWIEANGVNGDDAVYGYTTSLHWSLTQFTPAGMEVHPRNVGERIYSICVLIFAMVTFSSFLASISSSITHLRHFASEVSRQEHQLRRYLYENQVPNDVGNRIWTFLKSNHFNSTRMRRTDVPALESLPPGLRQELATALYLPYVTRLPFFGHLLSVCGSLVASVCELVMERFFKRGSEVFHKGRAAESIFILLSGDLAYSHSDARFECDLHDPGSWVCEHALWMQWKYCGKLNASAYSVVLTISSSDFREAVKKRNTPRVLNFTQSYARRFSTCLQKAGSEWYTDIFMDDDILDGIAGEAVHEGEVRRRTTIGLLRRSLSSRSGSTRKSESSSSGFNSRGDVCFD